MANSNGETYKVISGLVDFADGRVRSAGQFIELTAKELEDPFNQAVLRMARLLKIEIDGIVANDTVAPDPADRSPSASSDSKGDK